MSTKCCVVIASLLLASAVGFGAFGAHGLKEKLDAYSLAVYEKAVFYHFIHALGILLVTLLAAQNVIDGSTKSQVNGLLLFGVVVFSGSLYVLAISGMRWLGAITPIGGLAFIVAWLLLAFRVYRFN